MKPSLNHVAMVLALALALITLIQGWLHIRRHLNGG